jgi:hypothetical protein
MGVAKRRASIMAGALQKLTAKDAGMKAILVDAPETAWKEWSAEVQKNQAAIVHKHSDRTIYAKGGSMAGQSVITDT